ncbi:MAG: UDP-4-amino-4,6-dideoxy-N-acetyl-beta-L-altrosamine N-acetyltransferase [Eubacteriales bacterium]|nr:UDP-4-amino-4,6-dideoxy-N-acetyl-beta-L-altrosamine N-acetyltransferase [Eubacteriales bacterium]
MTETGKNQGAAISCQPERIEGQRIYLRPITMEDTERIVAWRNEERVRRNFIYQQPFTKEGHENWMRTKVASGEALQFIICEKESGRPVGSVYFRDMDSLNKKAEYGIFIGEADSAGKGIGTEAAKLAVAYARDRLKLHKLMLRVFADNQAAVKSYRNAGFLQEAYLKDEVLQNGQYRDLLLMAVLFEENR